MPPACHELHVCCTRDCDTPTTTTITEQQIDVSCEHLLAPALPSRRCASGFTAAQKPGHRDMHNIMMTARDSPVRGCFRFPPPRALGGPARFPDLAMSPGTAAYTVLYSTRRMDIDMRSPQFIYGAEKTSEFSSATPHARCKLPGLSQSYSLSLPAAVPAMPSKGPAGSLGPSWHSIHGRAPAPR